MDGFTVLQRQRNGGANTHVLLLTARDAVEDRVRGLRAGADDYLVKPFALKNCLPASKPCVADPTGTSQIG